MKSKTTEAAVDETMVLVSIGQVRTMFCGCSRTWVYDKLRKDPAFPRPLKLGDYTIAWRLSELREYMAQLPRAELSGLSGPEQRAFDAQHRDDT